MYRRVFHSLYRARRRAAEACVLKKCDIPPLTVFRVVNGGVKSLSTSPVKYCEKNDSLPPKQDGKSSTSMEGKADNLENKVTEMSQQVSVVGVVNSEPEAISTIEQMDINTLEEQKSNKCTSEERLEVRLEKGKEGEGMVDVGLVQTEAHGTIQPMDVISTPEVQKPKESTSEDSEERLELRLEEGSEGEGMVDVGLVQTEAHGTIQQMDVISTPEVQKPNESTSEDSEERLELRLEEGSEGEGMVDVGLVQTEAHGTIQQMDVISTPEVQKPNESTNEERLEEAKDGEGMVEIGAVQTEADNTIQQVDIISMPEVQVSKESTSEERLEEAKDGEGMVLVGEVQAEADHMDDVSTPEVLKNTEHSEKNSPPSKSNKVSLLDLLGAMKVDVTSKRKFKNMKDLQSSTPKPMESTESMFQKATEEASAQSDTLNPELMAASSAAAATLPNQSQAESELVTSKRKVKSSTPKPAAMESAESMFQKATEEASAQSNTLDPELIAAASAAAATLPNRGQAESELLRQLRRHEAVPEDQKKGDVNSLGVIIADMKVGRGPNRPRSNQIRYDDDGRGYKHDRGITAELSGVRRRTTLFSGRRLDIFSPTVDEAESAVARPTLWDIDFTNQIVLSTNQSPRNGLEEMIQWTKEGKLWEYPINNEAGLEEEMSVPFHEHIFLEKHLKEGFPQKGPVRHFMELVVAGLARNAHLTVQQKKDHISWFRDYFHQKEDVLKEADVYLN